jgi:hypothetical protein
VTNKNLLDRIDVKAPCTESWEEMSGNDQVRFCSHCTKNVVDLSAYTRARAEKLVRDSNGGLCVRYRKDERGRVITAPPKFTQIKRQAKIAAGVLAATLSVGSAAYSQGQPISPKDRVSAEQIGPKKTPSTRAGFTVSGSVVDQVGALIPDADIVLIRQPEIRMFTRTSHEGTFKFDNVEAGEYQIEVTRDYFKKLVIENVRVLGNFRFTDNLVLDVVDGAVVGELIITEEPLVCDDPPKVSSDIKLQEIVNLPLSRGTTFVTMGLIPGVADKTESKKPAKKSKKKLPK